MILSKDNKIYEIPDKVKADSGESYEVVDFIGEGGNAVVYSCIDSAGEEYAVKFLLSLSKKNRSRFQQEVRVLREINHPNLIRCIDEGTVVGVEQKTKNSRIPFMVMEKANSDLKKYLDKKGILKYAEYISQFSGLSEALGLLNKKVVHRDIKLENILIVGEKWVLSDLGLCTYLSPKEHEDLTGENENIGPKYWLSPEEINRRYHKDVKILPSSDVFQLAAVFWYVATGYYPLGVVDKDDWNTDDDRMCEMLIGSLAFNCLKRPQNGEELFHGIEEVKEYYETKIE